MRTPRLLTPFRPIHSRFGLGVSGLTYLLVACTSEGDRTHDRFSNDTSDSTAATNCLEGGSCPLTSGAWTAIRVSYDNPQFSADYAVGDDGDVCAAETATPYKTTCWRSSGELIETGAFPPDTSNSGTITPTMKIGKDSRLHRSWIVTDYSKPFFVRGSTVLFYEPQDDAQEIVVDDEQLDSIIAMEFDLEGRITIAYTWQTAGGQSLIGLATRNAAKHWTLKQTAATDWGRRKATLLFGANSAWIAWATGDYTTPAPGVVVDLNSGIEQTVTRSDPGDFRALGAWLDPTEQLHLVGRMSDSSTASSEVLVHAAWSGNTWSFETIQKPIAIPPSGDIAPHQARLGDGLIVRVDGGGVAHLWYWETDGGREISLNYAKWRQGTGWHFDRVDAPTHLFEGLFDNSYWRAVGFGFSPSGDLHFVVPGSLLQSGEGRLVLVTGAGCIASCRTGE